MNSDVFLFSVGNKMFNILNVHDFLSFPRYKENPKLIKAISEFTDKTESCYIEPGLRKEKD